MTADCLALALASPGAPTSAHLGRTRSAERRKTSRRFHNGRNWECQHYRVKVSMASTGRRLLDVEGVNDLALVSVVISWASGALSLCPSRVALIFEGRRLRRSRAERKTLYRLGAFRRCLEFEVIILPPLRCKICRYDLSTTGVMSAGKFVPGGEAPDYLFLRDGREDGDGALDPWMDQEDSDSSSAGVIVRDDIWRSGECCYCPRIASEFGWRSNRTWGRIVRNLRRAQFARFARSGPMSARLPGPGGSDPVDPVDRLGQTCAPRAILGQEGGHSTSDHSEGPHTSTEAASSQLGVLSGRGSEEGSQRT